MHSITSQLRTIKKGSVQRSERFLTEDQSISIMKDDAIFSSSQVVRSRSIYALARYGAKAIPALREIIECLPKDRDEEAFKMLCLITLTKIRNND